MQLSPLAPGRQLISHGGRTAPLGAAVSSPDTLQKDDAVAAPRAGLRATDPQRRDANTRDTATGAGGAGTRDTATGAGGAGTRGIATGAGAAGARDTATGAGDADGAQWSTKFTETFVALAEQADYPMFAALAPALTGINRQRVEALLSLP